MVESGKLDSRHKTWNGYYDAECARKNGQQKLLVDSLQWTVRGRQKTKQRAIRPGRGTASWSVTSAIPGILQPFSVIQRPVTTVKQHTQVYKQPVPHVQQGVQEPLAPTLAVYYRQRSQAPKTTTMQQADMSRYSENALAVKKQKAASWFETAKRKYASRRHHDWSYFSRWWMAFIKEHLGNALTAEERAWLGREEPQLVLDTEQAVMGNIIAAPLAAQPARTMSQQTQAHLIAMVFVTRRSRSRRFIITSQR
jgi:hypothetical protein